MPPRGFEWYRRAYLETPDAEGLQLVDQAAERHGLFEELIQIYEGARARASEPIEQLAASLKIALICEEKLRDPARAFATLCDALPADPAGRELLPNLERLAEQTKDWLGLLDVYARVARARTEAGERVELLRLRAEVRERKMADPSGALDEMLRSFALAPENPSTQEEILRLARVTGRWEEAIRVEGHLFALAEIAAREAGDRAQRRLPGRARGQGSRARVPRLPERVPAGPRRRRDCRPPVAAGHQHRHATTRSLLAAAAARVAAAEATRRPTAEAAAEVTAAEDDRRRGRRGRRRHRGRGRRSSRPKRRRKLRRATAKPGTPTRRFTDDEATPPPVLADAIDAAALDADDSGVVARADDAGHAKRTPSRPTSSRSSTPICSRTPRCATAVEAARPPAPPPVVRARDRRLAVRDALGGARRRVRRAARRRRRDREGPPQEDRRGLGEAGRRTSTARWTRWSAAFRLDIKDAEVRAELERVGGEVRSLGPDRRASTWAPSTSSGRSTPRWRCTTTPRKPARAPRAGRSGRGAVSRDPAPQVRRRQVALARVEEICREQERWEDLANVLEKRTSGPSEALPPGPERRKRLRELASLYEERLERPYEAIDTLERLLSEAAEEERAATETGHDARQTPSCWERTRRWRGCIRASACGARWSRACSGRRT